MAELYPKQAPQSGVTDVAARLKILEERYANLSRREQLSEQNMMRVLSQIPFFNNLIKTVVKSKIHKINLFKSFLKDSNRFIDSSFYLKPKSKCKSKIQSKSQIQSESRIKSRIKSKIKSKKFFIFSTFILFQNLYFNKILKLSSLSLFKKNFFKNKNKNKIKIKVRPLSLLFLKKKLKKKFKTNLKKYINKTIKKDIKKKYIKLKYNNKYFHNNFNFKYNNSKFNFKYQSKNNLFYFLNYTLIMFLKKSFFLGINKNFFLKKSFFI